MRAPAYQVDFVLGDDDLVELDDMRVAQLPQNFDLAFGHLCFCFFDRFDRHLVHGSMRGTRHHPMLGCQPHVGDVRARLPPRCAI